MLIGVDVDTAKHHAIAVARAGLRLPNTALPNDGTKLRELIRGLNSRGWALFVVEQPATVDAQPFTVAQPENGPIGYLPGLAMRRIADVNAKETKINARDAAIIAQAARSLPLALQFLELADEQAAKPPMPYGFDDNLGQQITTTSNRVRGLPTQIQPALERGIGPRRDHPR